MNERKINSVKPAEVKVGHMMAFVYYAKVEEVSHNGEQLRLRDLDNGREFNIRGKELVEVGHSADQFQEEEHISKTKAAELLIHSANRPLTVCFLKADGTERVLRGRLVRPEPLLGRSMVEDLEKTDPNDRLRQVDHRTLQYLIVDGVKYTVK